MIRPALARRLPVAVLLVVAVLVPACKKKRSADADDQNEDPPVVAPAFPGAPAPGGPAPNTNTPARPVNTPAASPKPASPWAGTAIPFTSQDGVTFGPTGCPVLVVGQYVFDAKTYKRGRKLPEKYEGRALHALSADGKYFASASQSPNQTNTGVTVWATDTGDRVLDLPGQKEAYADLVAFLGNTRLMVGGRHSQLIEVWDMETRKLARRLAVPDKKLDAEKVAFSPDGKHYAGIAHDRVVLGEVATNDTAAEMAPPGKAIGGPPTNRTDPIFVYAWTQALAFSPDGTELALFSTHPSPRLIVWSTTGEMVLDVPVPRPRVVGPRTNLEWLPDGKGWLVGGYLIDRATTRVVVSIRVPFASQVLPHVLDKDRVIGVFGKDDVQGLRTITLPWDKLNASLKQMTDKAGAYISPGEPISLQIDVTGLRGDEGETKRILTDALTKRLARDGVGVTPGRYTILWLKMSEKAGETLPIYNRASPFDFRGSDTGKKATEAKGAAVLELWAQGIPQPLWRGHLTAASSRSFREEITDQTIRKSMLDQLGNQVGDTDLPYFVPKSQDVITLPVVVE